MNGWLRHFVCLFILLHSFIHSLANRTKTECNVKQKLNGSNFFYYSFYFLLQHSTSFAFWAPPPSSTPSCRCDLEARLRGHFLQRRPSTPRLGLRACIVSRFGCDSRNRGGDLGLGGWLVGGNLGSGEERGAWLARIVLRFVHDSSTWGTMAEGKERVGDEAATKLAAWYLSQSVRFERWVGRLLPSNDNQSHSAFVRSIDNSHFGRGPGRACWKVSSRAIASSWPRSLFSLDRHQEEAWWGEERQKNVRMFGRWILKLH